MKKKILGLALALVMIISLLPLTALATPTSSMKVRIYEPNGTSSYFDIGFAAGATEYIVFEDVADATDPNVIAATKAIKASTVPEDNYIKMEYSAEGVFTITLKNVNHKRASSSSPFISAYENTSTGATNVFDIVVNLEGTNKIEGPNASFKFQNEGTVTIQGSGSLDMVVPQSYKRGIIWCTSNTALNIKNTTLTATVDGTSSTRYGIVSKGDILIEDAVVNITSDYGRLLATRDGATDSIPNTSANSSNITIRRSNVRLISTAQNASGTSLGSQTLVVETNGNFNIDNSTVLIGTANKGADANAYSAMLKAPNITGTYTTKQATSNRYTNSVTYSEYDSFNLTAGDVLKRGATEGTLIKVLNLVHTHVAAADDGDCTTALVCACGYEMAPAKTHIAGTNNDCTKATPCANEGCTKDFAPAAATAHVAGQDDGDCTTDILCSNTGCTQVATKGAEKHVWDRANCDVAGSCTTAGCTKTIEAGAHSGGTATCKDKAKCDECGKEYGELGACAPAADDGDCTTDIKCSVCGKTTTAGEAAHKYTDKNDTTCDNAGCTNTRKVEGTENPKTGDNTALVLMVSLMAVAAAAFVTTKKFAR